MKSEHSDDQAKRSEATEQSEVIPQDQAEPVQKCRHGAPSEEGFDRMLGRYLYEMKKLSTQLTSLQSENARLREALEKYSNKDNWDIFHVCDSYSGAIGCLFRLGLIDDSDKEGPDYAAEALSQTRSETTTGAGEKEGV